MTWIIHYLWLIPALPLLAAGLTAVAKQRHRTFAASLAIGSMVVSFGLSLCAFLHALALGPGGREVFNFPWFQLAGTEWVKLGWVLDPLTAVMLVMVTFVGTLIFIYSIGYMAHDENFTRFFCFLSLFAAAMLGVVIANSLLLLFISWELVGLTSYLLIGFWYQKPSAAAAAKKAFITTRIGDVAFLLGMVWLYSEARTLVFYDNSAGCLEPAALSRLATHATGAGIAVSTAVGLLIFCGAVGKSGQVPLHVWLPDAMEGPTPVSALIHAATMVAAGVFLVARVYPVMAAQPPGAAGVPPVLQVVVWVGAITAVFAASIAVAQTDIKRILAYSTVSQLGYMMIGLGVGGVAVGMFHLITHAFFKALLFMGAGSVIHGCHEEQDIRRMGGLRKFMPVTFVTYAVGMLALAGFPLFFSGFWSKDAILHAAHGWPASHGPFYLGAIGALLTAFYMTRQVCYVFYGNYRPAPSAGDHAAPGHAHDSGAGHEPHAPTPHESPRTMTGPLIILAICSIFLGLVGMPAWPWFQDFLGAGKETGESVLPIMISSSIIVFIGLGVGWWLYGRKPATTPNETDPLERMRPDIFGVLRDKFYVDEIYEGTIIRFNAWWARACDFLDRMVWNGIVQVVSYLVVGLSWISRVLDEFVVNPGFDQGCQGFSFGGRLLSRLQDGRVQNYLRVIGVALLALAIFLFFGRHGT